jgi:hypothetical protein
MSQKSLLKGLVAVLLPMLLSGSIALADTPADHVYDVAPAIVSFHQGSGRNFSMVFAFDVREKLPSGAGAFIHFTHNGEILLQYGTGIDSSPENWPVGQVIKGTTQYAHFPVILADGEYPFLVGLWTPATGQRLKLKGIDDGTQRYQAGILVASNHGRTLTMIGQPTIGADQKPNPTLP